MALLTKTIPVQAGAAAAFVASTPGGDTVAWGGGDILLEFRNGHASSITINVAPVATSARVANVGEVTPLPTRSLALAAGADGIFRFKRDEISAYLNASGILSITYTSGNAALVVRAVEVN